MHLRESLEATTAVRLEAFEGLRSGIDPSPSGNPIEPLSRVGRTYSQAPVGGSVLGPPEDLGDALRDHRRPRPRR